MMINYMYKNISPSANSTTEINNSKSIERAFTRIKELEIFHFNDKKEDKSNYIDICVRCPDDLTYEQMGQLYKDIGAICNKFNAIVIVAQQAPNSKI